VDFALTEECQTIKSLTAQVLGDMSTHERLKALTAAGDHVDREAWAALAAVGVAGAAVPERYGGLGLDFLALAVALEEAGRRASPVPLLTTAVMAAMPLAEFGADEQKSAWLPGIADGSILACAALAEDGAAPSQPQTTARRRGGGYVLDGVKTLVAGGLEAAVALVPARLEDHSPDNDSVGVFLVPTDAVGLRVHPVEVTTGRFEARFELSDAAVGVDALLGRGAVAGSAAAGSNIIQFIEQHANAGMCMMMAGSARAAIRLAAEYTRSRRQFDRPIATFQAVSQRAGDSYIDTEAIALTAYQAAWRLSAGLPAARETAIAKYWAAEAGYRVAHAAVHVHGGVGVDRDYPLHRHFLLARWVELTLGCAEEHLADLGRLIGHS